MLINLNPEKFSNYGNMLKSVYKFAKGTTIDAEFLYGNLIRKTLEAYSNFNYKTNIDKFLTASIYRSKIKDKKLREYFESRMDRLVLNAESHAKDIGHQYPDSFDFEQYSETEQKQTAKDVLVFLYELDNTHINNYMQDDATAKRDIEQWRKYILDSCT